MRKPSRSARRFIALAILTGGTLLQTTSCSTLLTDSFSSLGTSIVTNLIRREVYQLFNVSSAASYTSSSLTGK